MKQLVQFIALALFAGGCATPQGLNPTDSEVEIEDSNSNTVYSVAINISTMRDQIVQDVLKDLLKDLFPTGIPDLPIAIPGDLPPDTGGNSPPATNNPPPVVPDEPVSDGTLRGDFLWKPVAESGGLVVLMDSGLTGLIASVTADGEPGNFTGVGNGNREHYRWSKEGPQWPPNVMVSVTLADGLPITYVIADPANRASPSPQ